MARAQAGLKPARHYTARMLSRKSVLGYNGKRSTPSSEIPAYSKSPAKIPASKGVAENAIPLSRVSAVVSCRPKPNEWLAVASARALYFQKLEDNEQCEPHDAGVPKADNPCSA